MGKVVIEVPEFVNLKIKARNMSEAIRKLMDLKISTKTNNVPRKLKKFKGIAKFKLPENAPEQWYHQ
jgi:hypothetical protein